VPDNLNCDNRYGNEKWEKVEISGDAKLRKRTKRQERKSLVHMPKLKRHSVAAIRLLLMNQMPPFPLH
jgi:hypothetical protein